MPILDLKMMGVVHEHPSAPEVGLLFIAPPEANLHRAIKQVIPLDHDPLVDFPFVQASSVAAQGKLCHNAILILQALELFELDSVLQSHGIVCSEGIIFSGEPPWEIG